MILTRTPLRIPLGGGGTDLPAFYQKHGGFLFNAAIDKFVYVAVSRSAADNRIRITHSDAEIADTLEEVKHDLAREALKASKVAVNGLEIASFADMPPGTGLGSSGSYLVGTLKALDHLSRKNLQPQALAELACHIEIDTLKKPVGKQDQYLAAFGGFLCMEISKLGKVKISRPKFSQELIQELEKKVLMFYTYKQHDTVAILKEQSQKVAIKGSDAETAMLKIKEIGRTLMREMETDNIRNFGKLMHEHWQVKKSISRRMSDSWLDEIYSKALKQGAEGGKIMGSGGGGCFLFFVPKEQPKFVTIMEKLGLRHISYKFWPKGAEVIYQQ